MPYIANVYSLPPGSTATPNTTIESAKYNTLINDLATAQNTARPVLGGGTGGQTAVAGHDGLNTKGADITSGATTDLSTATGVYVNVTGTTTITALGTVSAGSLRQVTFTGILILTHNATSLILPGAANITTAAGDTATFRSLGSGNWKCVDYQRASGQALVAGTSLVSTDNAAVRFDGTSGVLQNSGVIIDDSNNLTVGAGSAAAPSHSFVGDPDTGVYSYAANEIGFATAGAFRANMTASGFNFGRALADPTVAGISMQTNGQLVVGMDANNAIFNRFTSDGTMIQFRRTNSTVGTIAVTTTATAYNTSSDARLKSELREFDSGALLDGLSFGEFTWLKDGSVGYGVLAQDAKEVLPQAVFVDDEGWHSVDYSKFVPILAAELKALRKRLADLEAAI